MSTNGCLSFPDAKPTDHSIYLQSSWNGPSGLRRAPFRSSSSSKCQVEKITICLSHLQKNQWFIDYQISLIVIARQLKFQMLRALFGTPFISTIVSFLEKRLTDFLCKVNQNQETKGAHMQVHVHEWVCHYSFDIKHFLIVLKSMT